MRLEFEPNVPAIPLVENELFEDVGHPASFHFNSLLKKGISAAQNGERQRARTLLTEAAECEPRSEDAWMWFASISDYPEELLGFLNSVLEINPENERAVEWLAATKSLLAATCVQRAVTAHEENSDDLADQCLKQALDYDENNEMAWFWKASLARSEDQRLAFLARVLAANPENEAALDAVTAIKHSQSQAAFDEAKAAAVAGNRQKALDLLDEFLQNVPDSVEAWTLKSHLSLGVDEKVAALEKALEIDPENAAARSGLAFLALTFGTSKEEPEPEYYEPVEAAKDSESAEWIEEDHSPAEISEDHEIPSSDRENAEEHSEPDHHEEEEPAWPPTLETVEFEEAPDEHETASMLEETHSENNDV